MTPSESPMTRDRVQKLGVRAPGTTHLHDEQDERAEEEADVDEVLALVRDRRAGDEALQLPERHDAAR